MNCPLSEDNSLAENLGHKFSTRDQDNDAYISGKCAEYRHGAWWYDDCGYSSLNGRYYQQGGKISDGVVWYRWKVSWYSMRFTEMKLRPL